MTAACRALAKAGNSSDDKMEITAMTTNNPTKVKPCFQRDMVDSSV